MAGLLFLWLCVEAIPPDLAHKHIALFSNNSPTVSWVNKMASRKSRIAAQLVRALALCLNVQKTCPLIPVHIPGMENALTDILLQSFGSVKEWECKTDNDLLTLFNHKFPLPHRHRNDYACDFHTADEGYYAGRVAATTQNWKTHWGNWTKYVRPLGLGPFLQVRYTTKVHVLKGFMARVRRGLYERGKRVQIGTVVGALTAIGQKVALACGENPAKVTGSKKLLPQLSQIYNRWRKEDPPTTKQLPVKADILELLAEKGPDGSTTELKWVI
jgi:hypothetical protein